MKAKDKRVCLLLGGNLNDVQETFVQAIGFISELGEVAARSGLYASQAWGMPAGTPAFINQALVLHTPLGAAALLARLQAIEQKLGRVRETDATGYQSRTIDIDIIFYNNSVLHTDVLTVPHPRMHQRSFVLRPMLEVAPDWQHPVLKKTVRQLHAQCSDGLDVQKL